MRRLEYSLLMAVLTIIVIYALFLAEDACQGRKQAKNFVQLALTTEPDNAKSLEKLCAKMTEEGISFAFWKDTNYRYIQNPDYARTAEVTARAVRGNTGCIFQESNGLRMGDKDVCLIDRKTAILLFGTAQVIGKQVIYQEKKYSIQGILQEQKELFVYTCEYESEEISSFDHLSLRVVEGKNQEMMAQYVQNAFNLTGELTKKNQIWKNLLLHKK